MLSPFLFTIYTSKCHLQKFSEDSSIVSCISKGNKESRGVVESFVRWSKDNQMKLDFTKTKEFVINFRRGRRQEALITIEGEEAEIVESYRISGVHINNKLHWKDNTNALCRRGQSHM